MVAGEQRWLWLDSGTVRAVPKHQQAPPSVLTGKQHATFVPISPQAIQYPSPELQLLAADRGRGEWFSPDLKRSQIYHITPLPQRSTQTTKLP